MKREKSLQRSITHHQQLSNMWVLSSLMQEQRNQAASNPPFVIKIHVLAGGTFLGFLLSATICFSSFTLPSFHDSLLLSALGGFAHLRSHSGAHTAGISAHPAQTDALQRGKSTLSAPAL